MDIAYYKNIADIPESLLIKSGTVIADYHNNDVNLSLEVCGNVKVWYKEEYYTDPEEYPKELTDILMYGFYNNEGENLDYRFDPDIHISENNWYELFELDDRGDKTGKSWVVDCDYYTEKDIREMFEETEYELSKEEEFEL